MQTAHECIESINDIDMYYVIRGEGEPLVLLHGWMGVGANFELIFKKPPENYRLVIPDLRGHGRSTNPLKIFTFRQSALDVFALLDRLGIERFNAMGISLGANTLLHMATQQPTRMNTMILISATPYFPEQARAIMRMMTPENRPEEEWEQMRAWHKYGDEQIQTLWRLGNEFNESYGDMNFTPPYLSTITAKTLIVHGDRDPLYPVQLAVDMYSAISNSYLWIIPNGSHSSIFGDISDYFVETILAFLR